MVLNLSSHLINSCAIQRVRTQSYLKCRDQTFQTAYADQEIHQESFVLSTRMEILLKLIQLRLTDSLVNATRYEGHWKVN